MESLNFELPVGLHINGEVHKDVELLRTNGVAEKVFVKKLSEKPFTWQGNVLAIAIKNIGTINIGSAARKEYLETNSVSIPTAILDLTLADVNTCIVEIHRRCWENEIKNQEVICQFCGKRLTADINLDKIDFLPKDKELLDSFLPYDEIVVNLKHGLQIPAIKGLTDKPEFLGLDEKTFNRFVFRPPLLRDAIKNEAYYSDSITLWRRIAMDCLLSVEEVDKDGSVLDALPQEFFSWLGLKLFNEYLTGIDLKRVRDALQDAFPTLPFAYYETCGCERAMEIPIAMEASNFFSE